MEMLRISKLTDYAVVLTTRMAQAPTETLYSVAELAQTTGIPEPTARKILKKLARQRVVTSQRGAQGGYRLDRPPHDITVREVIVALEGPIGVTECANEETAGACDYEGRCDVQGNWRRISTAIETALDQISLADMAGGAEQTLVPLGRSARAFASVDELSHEPTAPEPS